MRAAGPSDAVEVPDGTEVVDAAGKTVIPGFVDLHAHYGGPLEATEQALRSQLYYGVTTTRSIGADDPDKVALMLEANAGRADLPRAFTAGLGFSYPGGFNSGFTNTPTTGEEARAMVREQAALLQHGLRRDRSRRAPDQPDPLLDLLSREAVVLPAGCRRLQLRHHRGQPAGRHSRHGGGDLPVLQPSNRLLGGREVPLDYGLKLTGRVGRTEVGVLNVGARDTSFVDEQSLFVGRVRQNFWQQSYVGALVTSGNPALAADATTMGVDLRLATFDILGRGRNFVFNRLGTQERQRGSVRQRRASFGFAAAFPSDRFDAQVQWREIQENFDPALGFVQRRNVRILRLGAASIRGPGTSGSVSSRCTTTSSTRSSRGSTTAWSRAGTSTSRSSTGISSRGTRCTACSTSLARRVYPPGTAWSAAA